MRARVSRWGQGGEVRETTITPGLCASEPSLRNDCLTGSAGQGSAFRPLGENVGTAPLPAVTTSSSLGHLPGRHGPSSLIQGGRNRSLNSFNISRGLVDKAVKSSLHLRPLGAECCSHAAHSSDRQQEPMSFIKIGKGCCDSDLRLANSF